jgi:hypothetical protein
MSFWDIVWFIFITWAFVAYLMVIFHIIGDIFRDQELPGFAKAVWCLVLVIFPFLTALVYIGVRGRGMVERSARAAAVQRRQQDDYIREVAGQSAPTPAQTPTDQITKARGLLDSGAISQSEYDALKAKALASSPDAPAVPRARVAGDAAALDESASADRR